MLAEKPDHEKGWGQKQKSLAIVAVATGTETTLVGKMREGLPEKKQQQATECQQSFSEHIGHAIFPVSMQLNKPKCCSVLPDARPQALPTYQDIFQMSLK